ncbi:unnamed protein product [Mytilus coruscus]|uniref:Uncharacterized protein n=1 Tax=Mytilus coruscus TaxID=42192 RepID=A0A6J8AF96_MYTCO|nr:unnamed protein product [Mytilus coruscus]
MLKGGIMSPVLKKNKDRQNPANYRGITVTKIFNKILQSVLKSRIDIKIHQIQNQLQRGFTEAIPMIFATFLASEAIIQSSEDDQEVLLLTLDAEKAFDKLEHEILFNKVYHYGIDGDMWILLRNMYREMSVRIKWDDLVSDKISVNQGIQQGAKLSTSLYKCYNKAILDSVTESGLGCHKGTIGIATPTCADDILVLANSEFPENIKRNVRAVLLSKVGGILVSDFSRDYKNLLKEQLNWRQIGFDNMNDLIKAMPEVVRLEFSDKDMAYKMFGKVDPNSSYTPLAAKLAAESSTEGKADRRRNNFGNTNNNNFGNMNSSNANGDDKYDHFQPNMRGHYTLCYPKFKENDDVTKESLEEKYGVYPGLFEVHMIPRMIFLRYTIKESAIKCLEKYQGELTLRIAEEKCAKGPNQPRAQKRDDDCIMSKKKSDNTDEDNEVYVGNLDKSATENDVRELCEEFRPTDVRVRKARNDDKKVFAFITFNNLEHYGRKLNCRIAVKDGGQPKQNTRREESGGKVSWGSGGGQSSARSVIVDDDESWDNQNKSSSTSSAQPASTFSWKSALNQLHHLGKIHLSRLHHLGKIHLHHLQNSPKQTSSFGQNKSSFGQSLSQNSSSFRKGSETSNGDSEPATVFFGNLHSSITQEDLEDLVKEFSPTQIRFKSDGRRVFAFVVVRSEAVCNECINKFDQMDWKGRKIACKVCTENKPDKQNNAKSASLGGNMPWKSGGDQSSNQSNRNQRLSNNDDESWDTDKNHNGVSAKFGSLTIQTSENAGSTRIVSPPNRQQRSGLLQEASPKSSSQQKSPSSFQQKSPTKLNPSNLEQFSRSPKKPQMPDYSGMPHLEPAMPPLEPAIMDEMPPLEPIDGEIEPIEVFVANFPYHETPYDLMEIFEPVGAVDMQMINSSNTNKTTAAVVYFLDQKTADNAILQTHQETYKGRLLWVQIYENDPNKRSNTTETLNLSISVRTGAGGSRCVSLDQNTRRHNPRENKQMKGAESMDSLKSSGSTGSVGKSFRNLMVTYKLVMNKLGTRVRDIVFKPYEEIILYITSVFDEKTFWGQVITDANDSSLEDLENIMELLQQPESRIGFTKGLGRCTAKVDDEWYRSWIIADRRDFTIEVFNVDYGTTAIVSKKEASLTVPEIWDLQPLVRPFRIKEGSRKLDKTMEQSLFKVKVTATNADETGFLTEVEVIGLAE